MKHLVLLFLLIAGSFFGWRWVMQSRDRLLAGMWGRRLAAALSLAALAVVALFAAFSSTTWRLF